ncbi:MAG: VWA domain-containing protein [Actinomycetota bacterium]
MTFSSPLWLAVVLAIPLLFAIQWALRRRRMRYAVSYSNTSVLAAVAPQASWRRNIPAALFATAFLALAMGMAKPHAQVAVPRDEATVILTVDVSGSMQATDVTPDRMTAAKNAATSFINKLPDRFRVAVVAFSDVSNVLAQPTTDRSSALDAISSLQAEGGTAMGEALRESVELVQEDRERALSPLVTPSSPSTPGATPPPQPDRPERVSAILLLSDGENTTGIEPLAVAAEAEELDVPVYAIALGTPSGIVTVPDQYGNPQTLPVPPDYATLETIAETTGGGYFEAPSGEDLQAVYDSLGQRIGYTTRPEEVTYAFAGVGAILLLLATAASLFWRGRLP